MQVAEPGVPRSIGLASTLGIWPALEVMVRSGRLADHIVAPRFRTQRVEAPVFIVGHPRSGTTLLHRLMALDSERFATQEAWQLLVPSIALQSAVRRGLALDGPDGPIHAVLSEAGRALFEPVARHHRSGWREVEEDGLLMLHWFAAPHLELLSAQPETWDAAWLADTLPVAEQMRWLRWYRGSLQRRLHSGAAGMTILGKSPTFTGWLGTLSTAFPDARFIMLVRRPQDAIASFMYAQFRAWRAMVPELRPTDPVMHALFRRSCALYRHAEEVWVTLPKQRCVRVRYDRLVHHSSETLERIYDHFDWSLPDAVRVAVEAEGRKVRVPAGTPRLRTFGLRREEVARALDWLG
jgi:hypothetical protein